MTDVRRSISFGLKTSQQGFAYDEILALWRATGDPGVVDFARRAGRADHTPAPRCDRDQQPFAATDRAGEDGRHRRPYFARPAGSRNWRLAAVESRIRRAWSWSSANSTPTVSTLCRR